jgi:hypothetical protein
MEDKVRVLVAQGDNAETLWAKALGDDLFQIDNIPCGLRNFSLGASGTQSPVGKKIEEHLRTMDLPFERYERVFGIAVPPSFNFDDLTLEMEMLRDEGVDYVQLDHDPDFEVPIIPGAPAEQQRKEALEKALADLEAFAKGAKPQK